MSAQQRPGNGRSPQERSGPPIDRVGPRTSERTREEAALAERARAGDKDAFEQLYLRYAGYVRGYVGARVHDRAVVEDIASETWLATWKAFVGGRYEPHKGEFRQWLTGVARIEVAQSFAQARRHGHRSLDALHETTHGGQLPDVVESADRNARVEERALARTELEWAVEQIRRLPADQRQALLLDVQEHLHSVDPVVGIVVWTCPHDHLNAGAAKRCALTRAYGCYPPSQRRQQPAVERSIA